MKNTQVVNNCSKCGNQYKVQAYRAETAHYCSKVCWSKRRVPNIKTCIGCNKEYDAIDKRSKYCSFACKVSYAVGEFATAWKGGTSLNSKRAQMRGELKKWRETVYHRDNYTCQKCGNKGGKLHAHHIKEFAKFPDFALDVSNGITVCLACHEEIHGRKFGTPARFPKHCSNCGAKTTGKSVLCRSCSNVQYHKNAGHKAIKTCLQCGSQFTKRAQQVYCSGSCNMIARHARSKSLGNIPVWTKKRSKDTLT